MADLTALAVGALRFENMAADPELRAPRDFESLAMGIAAFAVMGLLAAFAVLSLHEHRRLAALAWPARGVGGDRLCAASRNALHNRGRLRGRRRARDLRAGERLRVVDAGGRRGACDAIRPALTPDERGDRTDH